MCQPHRSCHAAAAIAACAHGSRRRQGFEAEGRRPVLRSHPDARKPRTRWTPCPPKPPALPAGHPPVQRRPHRRAPRQSRHARRAPTTGRCGATSRSSSSDRARHRDAAARLVADPQSRRPDDAAAAKSAHAYQLDLEQGAQRIAAPHRSRGRRPRSSRRLAAPTTRRSSSTGRCATARRRSPSRIERAADRAGCERILVMPLYPQYAASTTGDA